MHQGKKKKNIFYPTVKSIPKLWTLHNMLEQCVKLSHNTGWKLYIWHGHAIMSSILLNAHQNSCSQTQNWWHSMIILWIPNFTRTFTFTHQKQMRNDNFVAGQTWYASWFDTILLIIVLVVTSKGLSNNLRISILIGTAYGLHFSCKTRNKLHDKNHGLGN